jgi:Tfp pilus assembly protein PilF
MVLLVSGAHRAGAADVRAIAQRNEPGVLVITGQRADTGAEVQSSGGCVDPSGLVLTTAHQVDGVENLVGRLPDGTQVALRVVALDRDRELALLQADRPLPVALPLGDSRQLVSGAPLVCIATPVNLAFTTVTGIVSNTNRTYRGYPVIQTDFRVSPGSSGGPVFDEHGLLVGVVIGKLADQEWVTVVNPLENAEALLARHGVGSRGRAAAPEEAYELVPAPGISEAEFRAIEAYNRGTRARMPQDKVQAYALAARLLPEFFEAWFNLTLAREAMGDLGGALEAATRAAALSEAHPGALRNLGRLHLGTGDLPAAEQAFAAALASGPASARALSELGEVHRRQGRLAEARAGFESALRLEPGYALAHYNLGLTLAQQGARAEAADAFEAYLRLRPDAADRAQVLDTIAQLRNPSKE